MSFTLFYGGLLVVVGSLTWLSRYHVYQKMELLLIAAWATTNTAAHISFVTNAVVAPTSDALVALCIGILGYRARSEVARIIVVLYVFVLESWVIAYVYHAQLSRALYDIIGVLFLTQLLVLGGASARMAIRVRNVSGGERLRSGPSRSKVAR